jgi:hypothetical protein
MPKLPDGFNCESKDENIRRRRGWGSLTRNISGVEGCAGAPGCGLERLTSKSITHMDLHKPNNKLVNAHLEHLWCIDEPWANMDLQDSPLPKLGGIHHLPPYNIFYSWAQENVILSHDSQVGILKIPKLGLL